MKLDKIHLEVADAAIAQQQALLDSANAVLEHAVYIDRTI